MSHQLLMIEDDARLARMVADYLGQSGFGVSIAGDGQQGLAAVQANAPELVILDLMLPDMDGLEVCRRIRALPGALARTPVLMLTAKGDPMDRIIGLEIGADDYLPKPFEPRELLARIRAVLRRHVDGPPAEHPVLCPSVCFVKLLAAVTAAMVRTLTFRCRQPTAAARASIWAPWCQKRRSRHYSRARCDGCRSCAAAM